MMLLRSTRSSNLRENPSVSSSRMLIEVKNTTVSTKIKPANSAKLMVPQDRFPRGSFSQLSSLSFWNGLNWCFNLNWSHCFIPNWNLQIQLPFYYFQIHGLHSEIKKICLQRDVKRSLNAIYIFI
ncbi:hypothetical protein QN277_013733 [Acacia crassicarpa]|uniref:Uncharacterized protein n=1 Tax=Acacia crassicarpa TaxID=499986 RepID=A0AAE1N5B2_9FABA|nr:hypothetical protein QN277_013733 [Acacia crassicarpa]